MLSQTIKKISPDSLITTFTYTKRTQGRLLYLLGMLRSALDMVEGAVSKRTGRKILIKKVNGRKVLRIPYKIQVWHKTGMGKFEWRSISQPYYYMAENHIHDFSNRIKLFKWRVKKWRKMKTKRPDSEALLDNRTFAETKVMTILTGDKSEIQKYLDALDFAEPIQDENERKLYTFIREKLLGSLTPKVAKDVIFAALIERIARTTIFLERMEKRLIQLDMPATSIMKNNVKSDYMMMQLEHRRCLETFTNLRFAEDRKGKTRVLEELRRTIRDEE